MSLIFGAWCWKHQAACLSTSAPIILKEWCYSPTIGPAAHEMPGRFRNQAIRSRPVELHDDIPPELRLWSPCWKKTSWAFPRTPPRSRRRPPRPRRRTAGRGLVSLDTESASNRRPKHSRWEADGRRIGFAGKAFLPFLREARRSGRRNRPC